MQRLVAYWNESKHTQTCLKIAQLENLEITSFRFRMEINSAYEQEETQK